MGPQTAVNVVEIRGECGRDETRRGAMVQRERERKNEMKRNGEKQK